jgi:KTSC domain
MPSTAIRFFRYDSAKRELQVTFVTRRRYIYDDVPPDVFDAFRAAFSKGAFFNHEIRDRYSYREVTHERAS